MDYFKLIIGLLSLQLIVCVVIYTQIESSAAFLSQAQRIEENLQEMIDFPLTWENKPKQDWRQHDTYQYLQRLHRETPVADFHSFRNDEAYCDKRAEYVKERSLSFDENGLPKQFNRYVTSDHPPGQAIFEYLDLSSFLNIENQSSTGPASIADMPLKSDVLYMSPTKFHKYHVMGSHFACESQKYNHLLNADILTEKHVISVLVRDYGRYFENREQCFSSWSFMPQTYSLADDLDCAIIQEILSNPSQNQKWLMKKSQNTHNALGVRLITSETLSDDLKMIEESCKNFDSFYKNPYTIQKYIENPLLVQGRKFDFRIYALWASLDPLIVFYHDGFTRMSFNEYDANSDDKDTIITTMSLYGKRNDDEKEVNWSMSYLAEYLYEKGKVEQNWLVNSLKPAIKKAILHLARLSYPSLAHAPQTYELFGLDFLLDENLHVWFLEIVPSPAVGGETEAKREAQVDAIRGALDIETALLYNADLDNVVSGTDFEWVYDGRKVGMDKYLGLLEEECL